MTWLVASTTSNLSTADKYVVDHKQVPTDYNAGTSSFVDSANPLYSPYFTPTSTSVVCVGAVFYLSYIQPASSSNRVLTCELMDGATPVASAQANFIPSASDTTGGTSGMVFFKFATPFTYTSTTASNWRFKISSDGVGINNRIYFRNGASGIAYFEVTSTVQAPTNGDTLIVTGHLTTAGVNTSVKVTHDMAITYGSVPNEGLFVGKGGCYSYGDSQAAAYPLTLGTDCFIRINSSKSDEFGFEMGTEAHPLTKDYRQKIICTCRADLSGGMYASDQYAVNAQYNYDSPRISIVGDVEYCRNSEDQDYSLLASDITIGTDQIVLSDDLGVTTNAKVYVPGTDTASDGEEMEVSAYNPATKTITTTTNFAKDHSSGVRVYVYDYNAEIESTSASYTPVIASLNSKRYTRGTYWYVKNFSMYDVNRSHFGSLSYDAIHKDSYFKNLHHNHPEAYCIPKATSENVIIIPDSNVTLSAAGTIVSNLMIGGVIGQFAPTIGASTVVNGLYAASTYPLVQSGVKLYDVIQFDNTRGIYFSDASIFDVEVHNSEFGNPLTNTNSDILTNTKGGNIFTARFINCKFDSATPIDIQYIKLAINGSYLAFQKYNQTANDHRIYKPEGVIQTCGPSLDDTTVKNTGEYALKLSPYIDGSGYDLCSYISKSVKANAEVIVYGYFKKNSSYGSATLPYVSLTSADGEIDTSATMTDVDDTWQLFTLTGNVGAANTFVTVELCAQSLNAGAVAYFGGMRLVTGGVSYNIGTLWKLGEPTMDETSSGAVFGSEVLANAVWDAETADHDTAGSFGKQATDTRVDVNNQGLLP